MKGPFDLDKMKFVVKSLAHAPSYRHAKFSARINGEVVLQVSFIRPNALDYIFVPDCSSSVKTEVNAIITKIADMLYTFDYSKVAPGNKTIPLLQQHLIVNEMRTLHGDVESKRHFLILKDTYPFSRERNEEAMICQNMEAMILSVLLVCTHDINVAETASCGYCGEKAKHACSKCVRTHYCDDDCQKRDWNTHKTVCTRFLRIIPEKYYPYYDMDGKYIK
jgi:hypothetical protein